MTYVQITMQVAHDRHEELGLALGESGASSVGLIVVGHVACGVLIK